MAVQPATKPAGGGPMAFFDETKDKLTAWFDKQPLHVEVAILTVGGSFQGGVLGAVMGSLSQNQPKPAPGMPAPPVNPAMMGGPLVQARNFAVLTGVNAGLAAAIKKWRGKDDVQTAMCASFGSGVAFSLVAGIQPGTPGTPGGPLASAAFTGIMFSLFQGAFYQLGKTFFSGDEPADGVDRYVRTRYMLSNLGLEKYEKHMKKGLLDDSTLMLLNESVLQEVKIPPGPRLHILHHLEQYRMVLKPGVPLPLPPLPPPAVA